jgi:hypothetical protein
MQLNTKSASIELTIHIENDLEVDHEGRFHLLTFVYPEEHEDPAECRIEFEEILDNLIEFYKDDSSSEGYGQLYNIANQLERAVERLREVAGYMEDYQNDDQLEFDFDSVLFDEDDKREGV